MANTHTPLLSGLSKTLSLLCIWTNFYQLICKILYIYASKNTNISFHKYTCTYLHKNKYSIYFSTRPIVYSGDATTNA